MRDTPAVVGGKDWTVGLKGYQRARTSRICARRSRRCSIDILDIRLDRRSYNFLR